MLKDRLAYGIIYIPAEFSEDIARGKQTQVSLYCDMSGLLYYKSLLNTNTSVSLDMNADIKMQRAGNTTNRQDEITAYPIKYEDVTLFNPANGFAAFLIPAVLILIISKPYCWVSDFLPEQPANRIVSKIWFLSTATTTAHYVSYWVKA